MQKLYEEMENRITTAVELGRIPENISSQHKGFSQWNSSSTRRDHDTILRVTFFTQIFFTFIFRINCQEPKFWSNIYNCYLRLVIRFSIVFQILIDGRDPEAKDIEGCALPTLVYLAREKRPQHHHNFKAGSMNALVRFEINVKFI